MFVANVDENGFENNTLLDEVKKFADKTKAPVVAVCAKIESEISDLNDDEKLIFLSDLNLSRTRFEQSHKKCILSIGFTNIFHSGSQRS